MHGSGHLVSSNPGSQLRQSGRARNAPGVIDSFGILEMVGAIEDEFGIQLDTESLDAEQITVLGPLSRFVAKNAIVV